MRSASAPVHKEEESPPPAPPRLKSAGALPAAVPNGEVSDTTSEASQDSNEVEEPDSEGFLQKDPLQPQIQRVFEAHSRLEKSRVM